MSHRGPLLAAACLLASVVTSPCLAQDAERAWRQRVDQLLDRWSNDMGTLRLMRAMDVLNAQLDRESEDGEALLERARLRLALPPADVPDAQRAALLDMDRYRAAIQDADRAAAVLAEARRPAALAVAYLAARYRVHAELRRTEDAALEGGEQRLLGEHVVALEGRRKLLDQAAGPEGANRLLRGEARRQELLGHLDQLGTFPRPIGATDTAEAPVDLSAYAGEGKVLLVVFWAARFPESVELLGKVQAVHAGLAARGLDVLAINLDATREAMDQALAPLDVSWRHCHDPQGLTSKLARGWSVRSLPGGVLIDHTGRVRYVRPWELDLRLAAEELLERRDRS